MNYKDLISSIVLTLEVLSGLMEQKDTLQQNNAEDEIILTYLAETCLHLYYYLFHILNSFVCVMEGTTSFLVVVVALFFFGSFACIIIFCFQCWSSESVNLYWFFVQYWLNSYSLDGSCINGYHVSSLSLFFVLFPFSLLFLL